ncbi:hypothetical protein OC842_004704 [Tilletia horrida]|uniref:Dickkopf N-terminal cysteine-rich domain-containing protein n=1 Tax=Tilletia horrida TaxID=155126 RepID=A0AAN6GBQ3_9BASI|nr:hypothetical protein OC842_004704 [Tilletia horrida]
MLAFIKANAGKFVFAILAVQLFAAVASATPLDLDDEHQAMFVRATNGTKYVGSTCKSSAECYSGLCQLIPDTTKSVCVRQPLGGPCFRGGNCASRHCLKKNGVGKCAPKLQPTERCSFDLACTSGRCSSTILNRDNNGEILQPHTKELPYKVCDYLRVGQKTCRNYLDCFDGLCNSKTGYCFRGQDGDSCIFSYQCKGLCSRDGKCYTPNPKAQATGEICLGNDQCTSNYCGFEYHNVATRPSLLNPAENVTVTDGICTDRPPYYYYGYGR